MNHLYFWILSGALFCTSSLSTQGASTIVGKVNLPQTKSRRTLKSRYKPSQAKKPTQTRASAAIVYLEGDFPDLSSSGSSKPAIVGQQNLQFDPALVVVKKGDRVEFPNFDDEYHNVLSYSKAKVLDLGRYRKREEAPSVLFDKPGVVELSCEIHEHMQATIVVVDTPYFAVTDADGKFRLENLPSGKYTLKAWINRRNVLETPVELNDLETLEVNLPAQP